MLSERIGSFLSSDLRHSIVHPGIPTVACPLLALALETYGTVADLGNGRASLRHWRRLDAVRAELDQASGLLAPLICRHQ
jgi:hypothetical protein